MRHAQALEGGEGGDGGGGGGGGDGGGGGGTGRFHGFGPLGHGERREPAGREEVFKRNQGTTVAQFPEPRFAARLPEQHALAVAAAASKPAVTLSLDAWNGRPYNSKVALRLLSSLGGVQIKGCTEELHCGASFGVDEAAFVETVQQSVNTLQAGGDLDLKPYVYSSAWIGGGLFCDTTYHMAPGNSFRAPLCNWAALDVERLCSNSTDLVEGLFKTHANFENAATAAGDFAQFLPYQPNNFTFTLEGAHSADNIPRVGEAINVFASRVGGAVFTDALMGALLTPLDSPMNMEAKLAMHNFITPGRSLQGAEGNTERALVQVQMTRLTTDHRNPYDTPLLHLLAYTLCPHAATRAEARRALGGEFLTGLTAALKQLAGASAGTASELGVILERACATSLFKTIPEHVQRLAVGAKIYASVVPAPASGPPLDEYTLQTVFALIAAKRVFCGAPRFGAGGADNPHYGLSLLSRDYAYLTGPQLGGEMQPLTGDYQDDDIILVNGFFISVREMSGGKFMAYPCRKISEGSFEAATNFGKAVARKSYSAVTSSFPEYSVILGGGDETSRGKEKGTVKLARYVADDAWYELKSPTLWKVTFKEGERGDQWSVYFRNVVNGYYEGVTLDGFIVGLRQIQKPTCNGITEEEAMPKNVDYYLEQTKSIPGTSIPPQATGGLSPTIQHSTGAGNDKYHLLLVRPNIEHEMLGIILGRGGTDELGATLWGQTELSCYDDSQHGIWGMSYKYHERAQVFNERNMVRVWDVAFDGYNGGMGSDFVSHQNKEEFRNHTEDFTRPYDGKSFIAIRIPVEANGDKLRTRQLPNPLVWQGQDREGEGASIFTDPEGIHNVSTSAMRLQTLMSPAQKGAVGHICRDLPDFNSMEKRRKLAGVASASNECTSTAAIAFQGSMRVLNKGTGGLVDEIHGSGHLGPSYVGVASVREGKGVLPQGAARLQRLV